MIPLADPRAENLLVREALDAAWHRVLDAGRYILGLEVEAFESEFAAYIGDQYGVGVANGTEAIEIALRALGVGPGDEVVTVSHTAVATATAIRRAGAEPVFVDIDPETFTMDPGRLQVAITDRTKAIVPVHLYGQAADLAPIMELAGDLQVPVVEDCAQSHGASYRGKKAGSFGALAAFSFYPTKNLGAIGDGGIVTTPSPDLAERCRLLREYGWTQRYVSTRDGWNSRLDELQAAILRAKLPYLDERNASRARLASRYSELLADTDLVLPAPGPDRDHVYHLYVVRASHRDQLQAQLIDSGIGCGIHYPVPVHQQAAFAARPDAHQHPLEHTERAAAEILTLPLHPAMTLDTVDEVANRVRQLIASQVTT